MQLSRSHYCSRKYKENTGNRGTGGTEGTPWIRGQLEAHGTGRVTGTGHFNIHPSIFILCFCIPAVPSVSPVPFDPSAFLFSCVSSDFPVSSVLPSHMQCSFRTPCINTPTQQRNLQVVQKQYFISMTDVHSPCSERRMLQNVVDHPIQKMVI